MLKGIPDDRDGLFDTIQRSKNHYQKRAYQCIKCMVALFSNCSVAYQILQVRLLMHETGTGPVPKPLYNHSTHVAPSMKTAPAPCAHRVMVTSNESGRGQWSG